MTACTRRLDQLAQRLDELNLEAILITDEINVRYLTGFTGDSTYLIVRRRDPIILSDGRYETQLASECPSLTTAIRPPGQLLPSLLAEVVGDLDETRIGIEADQVSLSLYRQLTEKCPDVEWVETREVVEQQRMIKDEAEIAITRQAVEIAQQSFTALVGELDPGWSEREVAYALESKMRSLGASGVSFPPIVAFGSAGALPHYSPGLTQLGEHSTLLIDWGACYQGYASDLTRTLHRQGASDEFRRSYQSVLDSQQAAIEAIRPGAAASEIDALARGVLERAGLAEAFKHGLGHGVGLQIHESPRMSSISDQRLAPGMIITVEPGVYFEGDFGIRIEDDVLVTEGGHEVLSSLPKGLDDCRLML